LLISIHETKGLSRKGKEKTMKPQNAYYLNGKRAKGRRESI